MEWDKIYAINAKYIDVKAKRFMAVSVERKSVLHLTNVGPEVVTGITPVHPKEKAMGERAYYKSNKLAIEYDDAKLLKEGEKITLMKLGNAHVKKITPNQHNGLDVEAEMDEGDKDFKGTKKLSWVIDS